MLALGFPTFLLFGAVLVLLGTSQAEMARDFGAALAGSGLLASLLSIGLGVGVLGAGPLVDRLPRRPLFAGATLLAAAALWSLGRAEGLAHAGAALAALGVAAGVYETLLNAVLVEQHGAKAARALLFVHSAATLGAMLWPPLGAWIGAASDWRFGARCVGAGHLLLAALAFAARFPAPARAAIPHRASGLPPGALAALAPLAVVAFSYIGLETALTVLAVPYATGALGLAQARGLAAISAFWGGLLAGRIAALLLPGRLGAGRLAGAAAAGALVLASGVASRLPAVELLFGATGALLGLVFPVMVALAGERAGAARGLATGLVVGAGALGGFTVPWLHGALGDLAGPALAVGALAAWPALAAAAAAAARGR